MAVETRSGLGTLNPRRVFYGWWIVGSGFLLMLFSTGVGFYGFSAFVGPIANSVAGGSREAIGLAVSIQRAESGVLGPIVGFMVDRVGPRLVLLVGFTIGGTGFILVSLAQELWQFYAAYFFLALGLGAGSFLVVSTAVTNWFNRMRGRALGFLFLGPGFAGLIVVLIVEMVEMHGWRPTLAGVGVAMWIVCIPLAMVMRRAPEAYGQRPDGDPPLPASENRAQQLTSGGVPVAEASLVSMRSVLRSVSYHQYVIAIALQQMGFSALVIYQIDAFETFGLTPREAGLAVLIWTIGGIPGRLASGFLSDMFDKRLVLAAAFTMQLIGVFFFLTTSNLWGAGLYGITHGLGWGMTTPSRLSLQGEMWGRAIFGRLMGIQTGTSAIPSILAPYFVGRVFDNTGDYKMPIILMFLPLVISIILILTIRRPRKVVPPRGKPPDNDRLSAAT